VAVSTRLIPVSSRPSMSLPADAGSYFKNDAGAHPKPRTETSKPVLPSRLFSIPHNRHVLGRFFNAKHRCYSGAKHATWDLRFPIKMHSQGHACKRVHLLKTLCFSHSDDARVYTRDPSRSFAPFGGNFKKLRITSRAWSHTSSARRCVAW